MIPIDKYPTDGATNENVLFTSLGAFWTQVFSDQAALKGMTLANAEEIFQSYYDLIEAIDSYSANKIAVFKKIKWLPIMIKKSELNSNVLKFGEGAVFNDPLGYIFGAAKPQGNNIYVVPLPDDLKELSIITNRVISPNFILVNNVDVQVKGNYLYFYGNPFNLANVSTFNLLDEVGNQVYYNDPLTGQPIPDSMMVLWVYNGRINTDALNYNIAYLFGVNLPISQQSKDILAATVKLYSGGPTTQQLKAICGAFLGIKPIIETVETVVEFYRTTTSTVLVTDQHVYKYDLYYTLDPAIQVGSTLTAGTVPVDAVQYYDSVVFKDWWRNKMVPKLTANIAAQNGQQPVSPAMTLPPYMFVGNYKYGLTFNNDLELITRAADGTLNFPVFGNDTDVKAFQAQLNKSKDLIAQAITGNGTSLQPGSAMLINPLDFLFKTIFKSNTALMKINFKSQDQLQLFTNYFHVIKGCLPKHVYMIFICDVVLPSEIYNTSNILDPATNMKTRYPMSAPMTIVSMNSIASQGPNQNALCKELVIVRTIPTGVSTKDYNFLDLTKIPS